MYFHLRQERVSGGLYMAVKAPPQVTGRRIQWLSGERHPIPLKTPIEVILDDTYGTALADFLDDVLPIMSKRLVDGLARAGVDNIDAYETVLVDPKRQKRFAGYFAVQVLGRVSAVDAAASDPFDPLNVGHTVVQYRKLAIDEKRATGLKLFRLHESVSTIVVNEDVKQILGKLVLNYVELAPLAPSAAPTR